MRQLAIGVLVIILGFALAPVFDGRVRLAVASAGLIGAALILSSEPILSRLPERFRRPDLSVKIEEEQWRNFQYKALFLDVKVRVKNRTGQEKQIADHRAD